MCLRALTCAVLVLFAAVAPSRTPAAAPARGVGPIAVSVADLDRSVAFYTSVLDFTVLRRAEIGGTAFARREGIAGARARVALLALGNEHLELREYVTPRGRPFPADSRGNDRWFQHVAIVTSDMRRAYARLVSHHVRAVSSAPQRLPDWNVAAAGIRAFYFRDPDAHYLEILQFPAGKGAPRWQARDRLFLGIDHTAIVVRSTEASLRFYRDALGMRVAGGSENFGQEQERLSGVAGAHVRITTLRAPIGPGIEFLHYVTPSGGRPAPADEHANDVVSWETAVMVQEVRETVAALRDAGASLVSNGTGRDEVVMRDPDGHAIELLAR
jgi:catechol 2,3-dioxygenase-like lactoylglutathione lyase family enzyme